MIKAVSTYYIYFSTRQKLVQHALLLRDNNLCLLMYLVDTRNEIIRVGNY